MRWASTHRNPLVLLVVVLTAVACNRPLPPTVTPKSARVLAVGPSGVQLAVTLDVTNPNPFPLFVRAVDGSLLLGAGAGAELGTEHTELASGIPASSTTSVTSELTVNWTNLAALTPFALSPAAVPYRFDGRASVGGDGLNVSLPFTLTGELSRAQLISAGLSGLSLPGLR
jgi:LEA14-like dessication related protein